MVNLRATFTLAHESGVLTLDECTRLTATAKDHHFSERTLPGIIAVARANGLRAATAERLSAFLETHYVDLKSRDAAQLLAVIRDLPNPLPPADPATFTRERSASFDTLYENERSVRQDGIDVPLRSIASYAALHHPAFDDLNFGA